MVDVGPTTPQQPEEFDPNGYWSPASQRPNPSNLQETMDGVSTGAGTGAMPGMPEMPGKSSLAFSADSFVPGGGKQASADTGAAYDELGMGSELSGMNQGAVEFVPGGVGDVGTDCCAFNTCPLLYCHYCTGSISIRISISTSASICTCTNTGTGTGTSTDTDTDTDTDTGTGTGTDTSTGTSTSTGPDTSTVASFYNHGHTHTHTHHPLF